VSTAAAVTLGVIAVALVLMMVNVAAPDLVLLGAVVVLAALGVVAPADAFAGFANAGVLTVAALFVVAAGLRETGAVAVFATGVLGRPRTDRGALLRLVPPVVVASAFLNNTTIVAALLPAVSDWARRVGVSPSRLLLPLSFAAILGGTGTLIGTSTNLVVAGMVHELAPSNPGLQPLGLFDITPVGVVVASVGGAMLVLLAPWLLPDRRPVVSTQHDPREYTMELLLAPGSRLAGRSVEAAGLRQLPGAFLMEIVRDGLVLPAVDAHETLRAGDRLVFVGEVDAMVELQRMPGLAAAPDQVFKLRGDRLGRRIVEAVVSPRHPLVGRSIAEGSFRGRYHAVVIAVARAGVRVRGRVGDIVLEAGDVLLLEAGDDFLVEQRSRSDFFLVGPVEGATPPRFHRAGVAGLVLASLVLAITVDLLPTVTASMLAAGAMLLTGCVTPPEARRSLDLSVLIAIASAFGLGHAMQSTGLADALAQLATGLGVSRPLVALVVVYVLTTLLTEVITNNAAAVLCLPVALSLADSVGARPMAFVVVVMFAASASFLSPIGYQTNLMVFNAGGYRPLDYLRLGLPLSVVAAATTIGMVCLIWPM
jgi:di/tricarboxylate transporter